MKKILTVLGARPQIIKSAAITRIVKSEFPDELEEVVFNTGQHYDANMSDDFFHELFIPVPKYSYSIDFSQPLPINQMIKGIDDAILTESPDVVLVYGDTNSTLAGAICAVKHNIPLVHVEAGLRSFNIAMPEEGNRILTDHSSELLFTPTKVGVNNLINEQINPSRVLHCGDVMYDNSLFYAKKAIQLTSILESNELLKDSFILFTCHRQSNTDSKQNLKGILEGVKEVQKISGKTIVFPIHPRTKKQIINLLGDEYWMEVQKEFKVIPPASFLDTIMLESNASFVMTDSGGIQKEAYFFKKKSIILREETEWVEIIDANAAVLVGAKTERIIEGYKEMLNLKASYTSVYGDGKAGTFICKTIIERLK